MNEIEIDIFIIIKNIIKNIHKIFLISLVFGALLFGISKITTSPIYESKTMVMIARSTDINQNTTYANLSKSNVFISEVINKLGLDMTSEEYLSKVSVEPDTASRMININVKDTIPERAADIANQTAVELKTAIEKFNNNEVLISDKAKAPKTPISPNLKKYTGLGIFLGFLIGVIYVLADYYKDTRIKSVEEIEKYYEIPIIGVIPEEAKGE